MELFDAIKNRRSIRKYNPDPVDDTKIETILEAGRWAPSWANTQCWKFVVVKDARQRAKLAETLMKIKLPDGKELPNPGTVAMNTVPAVIVVCGETGKAGNKHGAAAPEYVTDKGDWFMFDTALAVQNMVLAAHGLGLGTVIIGAFDAPAAEKVIKAPRGTRAVVMFPLGVPAQPGKAPPRKELAEIAVNDKWE